MNELLNPNIPPKKKRKLIKKVYEIVEDEVKELLPLIKKSSPLSSYWETEQTKEDLAVIDAIKTKETRYKDRIDWITNNPLSWDTQYVKYMTDLIKLDNAFNRGVDTAFEKRYDAQGFVKVLLSCVNISARIKWIKFISDNTDMEGFLAHEAQEIVPYAVSGTKDEVATEDFGDKKKGDMIVQGVDYGEFTPLLTAAMKELITKVETLEQENIALRARVTNLEGN